MFKTFAGLKSTRTEIKANLNHSGRSYIGETLQLEGDLRSSGSVDVAGLINGNVFISDIKIKETGSIRGSLEATSVEISGHVQGKITADTVIIGKNGIEKILEIDLSSEEKEQFNLSIKAVRDLFTAAIKIDKDLAS